MNTCHSQKMSHLMAATDGATKDEVLSRNSWCIKDRLEEKKHMWVFSLKLDTGCTHQACQKNWDTFKGIKIPYNSVRKQEFWSVFPQALEKEDTKRHYHLNDQMRRSSLSRFRLLLSALQSEPATHSFWISSHLLKVQIPNSVAFRDNSKVHHQALFLGGKGEHSRKSSSRVHPQSSYVTKIWFWCLYPP